MTASTKHTFSSLEEALLTTLSCFNALKIYPTSFELFSFLLKPRLSTTCAERDISYADILDVLEQLKGLDIIREEHGFYFFSFLGNTYKVFGAYRLETDGILDQKWRIVKKKLSLFRFLPFVEGVFVSGSLAAGTVREGSDFDFLIISQPNRLYTLRLFSVIFFDLFGMRRKPRHRDTEIKNKICLNHYLSSSSLVMKDQLIEGMFLYTRLLPVYMRNEILINHFFQANEWIRGYFFRSSFSEHVRYSERPRIAYSFNGVSVFLEFIFRSHVGDVLEKYIYEWQKKRIPEEQNLFATPHELNLHPNLEERHARLKTVLETYFNRLW
ncbi:MAG: nucleotidyltransferase domain-containing protein [Parcubacteria group bacterium]|nr:nucleotidyltransferase domain-containing protein [Parcubacteria group bacterium]